MDPRITPEALTPSFLDDRRFGVWQGAERFPALSTQSVALPHNLSPLRSCCDKFRGEPAISSLDWPFTPIRRSSERFAHHYRFGPPPPFRGASTCPRIDQLASGIPPMTPGERTSHLTSCDVARLLVSLRLRIYMLSLAIDQNSLARYSKRTIQRCSTLSGFFASTPYQLIAAWFQALLTSRQGYFSVFTRATTALSVSSRI